jgi:hypothetical protein
MLLLTAKPGMVLGIETAYGEMIYVHFKPRTKPGEIGVEVPHRFKIFRVSPGLTVQQVVADRKRRIKEGWAKRRLMNPPGGVESQKLSQEAEKAKNEATD